MRKTVYAKTFLTPVAITWFKASLSVILKLLYHMYGIYQLILLDPTEFFQTQASEVAEILFKLKSMCPLLSNIMFICPVLNTLTFSIVAHENTILFYFSFIIICCCFVIQDIAVHTRVTPMQRIIAMKKFINSINTTDEARKQLENWGLELETDTIRVC